MIKIHEMSLFIKLFSSPILGNTLNKLLNLNKHDKNDLNTMYRQVQNRVFIYFFVSIYWKISVILLKINL